MCVATVRCACASTFGSCAAAAARALTRSPPRRQINSLAPLPLPPPSSSYSSFSSSSSPPSHLSLTSCPPCRFPLHITGPPLVNANNRVLNMTTSLPSDFLLFFFFSFLFGAERAERAAAVEQCKRRHHMGSRGTARPRLCPCLLFTLIVNFILFF